MIVDFIIRKAAGNGGFFCFIGREQRPENDD